jgi:hypothetical protein
VTADADRKSGRFIYGQSGFEIRGEGEASRSTPEGLKHPVAVSLLCTGVVSRAVSSSPLFVVADKLVLGHLA